jgi:hypothetical protein
MVVWLVLVVLGVLALASYLDLKYKAVPSVLLTGMIFAILVLRSQNILFGIAGFVFAILIQDLLNDMAGMEFGVADIKVFAMIGLMLSNFTGLMIMIACFLVFQFVYTLVWKWKVSKEDQIAFIPCLWMVYIALMVAGVVK